MFNHKTTFGDTLGDVWGVMSKHIDEKYQEVDFLVTHKNCLREFLMPPRLYKLPFKAVPGRARAVTHSWG